MNAPMKDAYDNGMLREQALFPQREQWDEATWWDRVEFIKEALRDEEDSCWRAELLGRLMAVLDEGAARFER